MDKFYLDVSQEMDEERGFLLYGVDIVINWQPLIELVREIELPFAQAENKPELAGDYSTMPVQFVFLPSRDLLPETDEYCQIFICGFCGDFGCGPLHVRIKVEADWVIWSDFSQPHRSEHKPPVWRYDGLGLFVFDRQQYEAELGKMLADDTYQEAQLRWEAWLKPENEHLEVMQPPLLENTGDTH